MAAVGCCRGCVTGLRILDSGTPVPLKSIDVEVSVKGFIASVTATLIYRNTESTPIEAIYEFPLDDQSAVFHFEAQTEGRTIIAECQEKQQAKETYQEALDQGFAATYMEQDETTTDIFRCKVGNLPPSADMTIRFAYVTELTMQPDGGLTFTLYTLLNPRYNPKLEDGGAVNPPNPTYVALGDSQPYAFTFRARITNVSKISGVTSKDELTVTFSESRTEATVGLVKPFLADHDLSIDIKYEDVDKPHALVEAGNTAKDGLLKHDVVMLNFFPKLSDTDYSNNHEFIFVIDRSGSMQGPRILSAKDTLLLFLKSLPAGCYFNIIGFGSHFAHLFPEGSKEYSEESLNAAMTYQKQLEADFGGTEILAPLNDIYCKHPMTSHSRQVFLLTDGEVGNTAQVIDIVRKNSVNTRVFTFGIGEGASTALVKGVARAGRGKAEFIKENERMQPLVIKTLKAAMQTGVSDLTLDWQLGGSPKLTQVPKEFPPLFGGDRLIVYAVSAEQGVLDGRVVLRGKIGARGFEYPLDISGAAAARTEDDTLPIHRLAAKAQIQLLQDQEKDDAEGNKAAIVLLSLASNIVSRHTAMVGVDKERSDKVTGQRTVRQVPVMQDPTLRYGGAMGGRGMRKMKYALASSSMAMSPKRSISRNMPQQAMHNFGHFASCGSSRRAEAAMSPPMYATSRGPSSSAAYAVRAECLDAEDSDEPVQQKRKEVTYMSVVELQTFAGSWKLTAGLADVINVALDKLKAAAPVKSDEVWGTVLALVVLSQRYAAQKDEWDMVEHKARQWLGAQDLEGKDLASLLASATAAIQPPTN